MHYWRVLMHNEFTAIFEQDGDWLIAYCPEIPGANGQGRTRDRPRTGAVEAVPRHTEISNQLVRNICRSLSVPDIG